MTSHEIPDSSRADQSELPLDEVELTESEQDFMDALTDEEQAIRGRVPQEVLDLMHETALREDGLRMVGYRPERIGAILRRKWGPALTNLAIKGVDISGAFPDYNGENIAPVHELRRLVSQEEYDKFVDDLVDKRNIDYTTASGMVDQKYYVK